ncbi:peptidylprolyl isomerase [Halieaceae bacterium IMCC14734]|uniref:Peptidylprolyl isomerase n=1 Tax=Candidatus Litorirhabdus singularis TaxID=2518993 RepID=A0ABT3TAH1_9GAMM|nr:fatty acid cis/trans isomerase [Candidatus Litorirhabdus singularis]MCX2979272.1 peptidylprolyl isomerase [Candidatus Litorirhabdus singularis]
MQTHRPRNSIFLFTRPSLLLCVCAFLWWLPAHAELDYPAHIKPLVEQRCMVCHGCYDAPCQLKLDAFRGLARGAHKDKVYSGTRLRTAAPTRLLVDGQNDEQWRAKGFYPVLDTDDPAAGQMLRLLQLKADHPLPAEGLLPDSFDFGLDRDQQCPKPDQMDRYVAERPLWGMPYGLPGLNSDEQEHLVKWLQEGAPSVAVPAPGSQEQAELARWEAFFNGVTLKQQLMARYMYEHLYIAALHFPGTDIPGYFALVRSSTPPGQPIRLIATRRPYDSPGDKPFWYRLQRQSLSVLTKRHMPYALDPARMQRWRELFIEPDYAVTELPDYDRATVNNPFKAFAALPVQARYRFMLDEAQYTIMGYIKGPVCRGQVALNVIDDHFWVVFVDPDIEDPEQDNAFLTVERDNMRLPVTDKSALTTMVHWRQYARSQRRYLEAKSDYLEALSDKGQFKLDTGLIWDGDGHNENAALTIFRHFDSASVHKGMVGQVPKTAWVISYSLLERIHYLLVAGFDVFGHAGHQLETRLYMDFLRMEGEYNFLILLPEKDRLELRDFWYRDAPEHTKNYVLGRRAWFNRETDVEYATEDPKSELLLRLRSSIPGADAQRYQVDEPAFTPLQNSAGVAFSYMPDIAFVDVLTADSSDRVYTLIRNIGHSNITDPFRENKQRLPEEDYLTVVRGFVGYYPNVFFQVNELELPRFVAAVAGLSSEADFSALMARYGVRRNASYFWHVSDRMHRVYRERQPLEAGLFDLNRYQNR